MLGRVGEEPVQDLPRVVDGSRRPPVLLDTLREEPVDHLGRDLFEQAGLDVTAGVLVEAGLDAGAVDLRSRRPELEGLADRAEEDPESARVLLA
ncbi:MAG: hypothetical protein AMS14_01305 [Planctomycetes bacterium DG_20]|nr:MAG: hypothetical protein AMS14_01305 [Planctomycetes bacterium DG_20]